MQGAQIRRNEAYYWYAAMTEDAAQRSRWTFCEVVKRWFRRSQSHARAYM